MGYIIHDAIVVTAFKKDDASSARTHAERCELAVTPLVASPMNGYWSFLIAPDGSKEGWPDSDLGEAQRAKWIEWARGCYDRGVYIDWVLVHYGGDIETGSRVTDSNKFSDEDEP
jgi:hypothetical protein